MSDSAAPQTREERLAALLAETPYMGFLGMTADLAGDEMTTRRDKKP